MVINIVVQVHQPPFVTRSVYSSKFVTWCSSLSFFFYQNQTNSGARTTSFNWDIKLPFLKTNKFSLRFWNLNKNDLNNREYLQARLITCKNGMLCQALFHESFVIFWNILFLFNLTYLFYFIILYYYNLLFMLWEFLNLWIKPVTCFVRGSQG